MALTCTSDRPAAGVAVLIVQGDIDAASAQDFAAAVEPLSRDAAVLRLILDLSGVDYVASAGLRVFLGAIKELRGRKGVLCLAGAKGDTRDILATSGMFRLAGEFATVAAALP